MSRLHKPKAGFWIRLCVVIIYPLDRILFRLRFRDLQRIPAPPQGVIVAINHVSVTDTLLMARVVWQSGRVPRFMIKASVFGWPVAGRIVKGAGQIPVYRGTADAAASLKDAVDALSRGECVVIYPEGTTTKDPDGWPMQGKTGIARLALLSPDTPIIPVGQWGAHKRRGEPILPRLFKRRVCEASVGEPVDLRAYRGSEASATNLRAITDTIMNRIRDEVVALRGEAPPSGFTRHDRTYVDRS